MSNEADKRTVGLNDEGAKNLEAIMATEWFNEEIDAFRLAISVALANDNIDEETSGVTTKWNVGTLDPDGKLRAMIKAISDEEVSRPFARAEALASAGLVYLKRRLVDENARLADVLLQGSD